MDIMRRFWDPTFGGLVQYLLDRGKQGIKWVRLKGVYDADMLYGHAAYEDKKTCSVL